MGWCKLQRDIRELDSSSDGLQRVSHTHTMWANTKNRKQQHENQRQHAQDLENKGRGRRRLELHKWKEQCGAAAPRCV